MIDNKELHILMLSEVKGLCELPRSVCNMVLFTKREVEGRCVRGGALVELFGLGAIPY